MARGRPPALTPERSAEVARRYEDGETPEALARDYGVSATAVANALRREGVARRSRSAARKAALADPAVRAKMSAARKAAWATKRTCPPEFRPFYAKLRSVGMTRDEALDEIEKLAAEQARAAA